jgi:hypothetical protein
MGNERTPPGVQDPGPFYQGTKVDLEPDDVLRLGYRPNLGERRTANYVPLTATLDAAPWERNCPSARGQAGSTKWSPRVNRR